MRIPKESWDEKMELREQEIKDIEAGMSQKLRQQGGDPNSEVDIQHPIGNPNHSFKIDIN